MHSDEMDVPDDTRSVRVRGEELVRLDAAIQRLSGEFPDFPASHLRSILTREWEAMTGGWPAFVPIAVEVETRRTLRRKGLTAL